MANYKIPGVYTEKVNTGSKPIDGVSTSVVAFMGLAPRGDAETGFVMISSWTDFVQKASFGSVDSVFRNDDYMAYNIYNFYQNGGGKAYFGVVKPSDAVAGKITAGGITFTAKSKGKWSNGIAIKITANAVDSTKFDVLICRTKNVTEGEDTKEVVDTTLEQYKALSNNSADGKSYWYNALQASDLFTVSGETMAVADSFAKVAGGADGTASDITDADFIGANGLIHKLDTINDVSLIINGGETSDAMLKGIIDYCTNRGDLYAILDAPDTMEVSEVVSARQKLSGLGEIHYPYTKMADPITGITIDCPASGMIAGTYARMDTTYGVWRAGAGEEAVLRGALGTKKILTDAEFQTLFEAGVNCIISKPNAGVLMYGARSLNQTYVSDDRLDIYVDKSIKQGTEWAVFEINDDKLWLKLRTAVLSFLEGLYLKGAFKGTGEGSAFYCVCDASINTDANIEKGIVTTEYGYANKKPAEFVVHRLNKITASATN